MSSAQTEVRSALAAYIEGATPLPVFEQSVARLLAGRGSARGIVQSELKAAVADGTLPPESLRRLGLADTPAPALENPEPGPRQRESRQRPRHAVRNRDSGGNPDQGARPSGRSRGRRAAPASFESADTGSDWADNRPSTPQIAECGGLLGNRYRLERILGEGGMGVVFLAVDQEVRGEMFAVKVLRPEIRANPESLRLLREEVRRTRALRHPHIVGVYSLNSDPSGVYMLMEYLEGKSLKTVLDEEFGRGMPLIRAWPMIYDVGAALAYAHDHNVIHSDIKPSNVIITSSGSCKLLDFGIARADRNRTTTRDATAIGALTPAYACCEMFEGRAPDQSDDVYAFACVIYEMLTGRHPYGRMAAVEARARKLQPAPIKALTNRQNAALARALEFNRERRTASVEILLEGLKGMANNQRDRRAWVTSGAAVAAVFAVSSGWFWEHHNAHRESAADLRPTTAPAPAPSPEPNPFGTPVTSKAEHGQQAARPDTGVAGPSTAASPSNVKSKTTAAVIAVPATLPAAMTAALPLAPAAAPVPTTPGAAAPLPTTPAAARAAAPVPAANLEAVLPAANKPAVAPATLPVETKVAAVSTAATTTQAATGAPAVKGTTAKTDGTLPTEPAKPISAALAAPAAADLEAFASTPVPIAESPPLTPAGVAITSAAIKKEIDRPPFGKKVPGVVATTESQSKMQSEEYCPYPAEARKEVQTGTVVMLVYVTPDGSTANAELDEDGSSGSPVLDQAAVKCVRELGRFPVKLVGSKPVGYWARTKFVWSFGG